MTNRKEHRNLLRCLRDERKGTICSDCHGTFPKHILEFDHINPENKVADIGILINKAVTIEVFIEELNKCEVLCSNCHKEREHKRKLQES